MQITNKIRAREHQDANRTFARVRKLLISAISRVIIPLHLQGW